MENIDNYLCSSDFPPFTLSSSSLPTRRNPRKRKRPLAAASSSSARPCIKKPDPSAPKITDPCTECGKRFWSYKALYGHMRCHPERQWRGINPPPLLRRPDDFSDDDHHVAACLLLLANGPPASVSNDSRFECSSCKKVFASHQALGGHRASHKNVKGCYAITKNDGEEEEVEDDHGCCSGEMMMMMMFNDSNSSAHKCSICFRAFSTGQALGGHMRCHWDKAAEEEPSSRVCDFDLNLTALQDDDDASSLPFPSGDLPLDLRLGF